MAEHGNIMGLPAGTVLDRYRIVEILGSGGFGITYLAEDTAIGRRVAIKEFLPRDFAARARHGDSVVPIDTARAGDFAWGLERFVEEARTLARFEHPNIVTVFAFFEANGTAYYVMRYVDGRPLDRVAPPGTTLGQSTLDTMVGPLLDGLEAVHAAGFLHRDIKPANIFIRSDGAPVLIDFGAARQALGEHSRTLTAVLSPGYAPIEQYHAEGQQGPWTDLYALGATLYRCVTGTTPAEATLRVTAQMRDRPDPLLPAREKAAGGYDPAFLAAIDAALQVHDEDRPRSVAAFRALLRKSAATSAVPPAATRVAEAGTLLAGAEPAPEPVHAASASVAAGTIVATRPARRLLRRKPVLIAAACLVVAATAGGWAAYRDRSAAAEREAAARSLAAEQRRKAETEEAQRRADARRRAEEEAKRKEEEEAKRREAEAAKRKEQEEARRKEEEEAKRKEQEEAKRKEQEEAKRKEEEEAKRKADELRIELAKEPTDCDRLAAMAFDVTNPGGLRGVLPDRIDADRAIAACRDAVERFPEVSRFKVTLSRALRKAGRYDEVVALLRPLAEAGDAAAQLQYGFCFQFGHGVAKDASRAFAWFRAAASQGHARAEYVLGVAYLLGQGVDKDEAEAARWVRRAAEQGDALAENRLGSLYAAGRGIARDDAEALRWFRRGAERGNPDAEMSVGVMYRQGRAVAKDEAAAARWFRRAADQGHAGGQFWLGLSYEFGRGVDRDGAEAVRLYRLSAAQGYAASEASLGFCYERGIGVAVDYAEAARWFRRAADRNYALAQYSLGRLHEVGRGVALSREAAIIWYRRAAAQGLDLAKQALARLGTRE